MGFLGKGAYFYHGEQAFDEAKWWAEKSYRNGRITAPLAIVKANIQLGRCLDFDDPECLKLIRRAQGALRARPELLDGRMPIDAAVVAWIAKTYELDTVRAQHPIRPFSGSRFFIGSVTYICVRSPDKILDVSTLLSWTP
jgi:hypothetical protein